MRADTVPLIGTARRVTRIAVTAQNGSPLAGTGLRRDSSRRYIIR